MKRLGVVMLSVLVAGGLILPSTALSTPKMKPPVTTGSMTTHSTWHAGPGGLADEKTHSFHYVWTAIGRHGRKPAGGRLTLTISHVLPGGRVKVDAVAHASVWQVTRVSRNTVDFWTDLGRTYNPGDPAHASGYFRAVDKGKTGDRLLTHCPVCSYPPPLNVFHELGLSPSGWVDVR